MPPIEVDPWAWSLETVLALIGVAVGFLGAVATVVVASLALAQTKRANRLEAEALRRADFERGRQRRVELVTAIDKYLTARMEGVAEAESKAMHDTAVAAGFPFHAPQVEWAEREAEEIRFLHEAIPRDADGSPLAPEPLRAYLARQSRVRMRLFDWVATGEFDRSSLPSNMGAPDIGPDGEPYPDGVRPHW